MRTRTCGWVLLGVIGCGGTSSTRSTDGGRADVASQDGPTGDATEDARPESAVPQDAAAEAMTSESGVCGPIFNPCSTGADCCSGNCDPFDSVCCAPGAGRGQPGDTCTKSGDCCDLQCDPTNTCN